MPGGTTIAVRPIQPGDPAALQQFHSRLSETTIYHRFFNWIPRLSDAQAAYFTQVDGVDRYALVALDPRQPGEITGVVRFDHETGQDRAEYAAVIADAWQHRGLGGRLTRCLVPAALARGIHWFDAFVLPDNWAMIRLFERLGLPLTVHLEEGDLRVALDLRPAGARPEAFLATGASGP